MHFIGRCGAWLRIGATQMGCESCRYPHSLFIVLVCYNNPSDLLWQSKRRVRLMSQMMAENLHFDFVRLVCDTAAGCGWVCDWSWSGRDGREACGFKRRWDGTVLNRLSLFAL